MEWGPLLILTALATFAGLWHRSLEVREAAFRAAQETCTRAGLQLLDDTISFQTLNLSRDRGFAVLMVYSFEYSDDRISRRRGAVFMRGRRAQSTVLEQDARSQG
jgi:Protein of unknown function (DUF3301)